MGACGVSCVKYLVFVFNLLFALTGLTILCVGAIIQSSYHHYSTFVGASFWSAPILMIVVGAVVFVIAFLGCCGALKENSCMVLTFCILLLVIFLCELGIGIAGYIKNAQIEDILETGFNKTMAEYNNNKEAWRLVQTELHCCGINGPADYIQVYPNGTLPNSCCVKFEQHSDTCTQENAIKKGCLPILLEFFKSRALILGGVGIGIAVIQA
ncbi:CD63 antigen [Pseudolycoriella hygida]|uniref:Tetraspanin n=1 Tax=Pseudolycoriella hygida TaxID=35572 RepID=A0A9Q0NGM8_9DIPT|nr:CD63 antigen [Pseudolycoriella hygida]